MGDVHHVVLFVQKGTAEVVDNDPPRFFIAPAVKFFVRLEHEGISIAAQYTLVDDHPEWGRSQVWVESIGEYRDVVRLHHVPDPSFTNTLNPPAYRRLRQLDAIHTMTCCVLFGRRPMRQDWHTVLEELS